MQKLLRIINLVPAQNHWDSHPFASTGEEKEYMQGWTHEQAFSLKMFILTLKFPWPLCIFGKLYSSLLSCLIKTKKKKTHYTGSNATQGKISEDIFTFASQNMLQSKKIVHLLFQPFLYLLCIAREIKFQLPLKRLWLLTFLSLVLKWTFCSFNWSLLETWYSL